MRKARKTISLLLTLSLLVGLLMGMTTAASAENETDIISIEAVGEENDVYGILDENEEDEENIEDKESEESEESDENAFTALDDAETVTSVNAEEVNAFENGETYIIADTDGSYAMSVNNDSTSTSSRAAVAIQVEDGTITADGADMSGLIWTCTVDSDGVRLANGGKYLTAYYSYLYAQETPGNYYNTWKLTDGIMRSTFSSYGSYCVKYVAGSGFKNAAASSTTVKLYKVAQCAHENKTNETTVPATCTEDGSYSFYCSDCEKQITKVIPALGHDGVLTNETDTYWEYTCSTCGKTYQIEKDERIKVMTLTGVSVEFSTDGAYEWEYDATADRLQSTNAGKGSTNSVTTITFSAKTAFTLSFDYSISSESNYDYLTLTLDGKQLACTKISSKNGVLLSFSYPETELSAGEHTLTLDYKKDSSGDQGDDRAYLGNLTAAVVCDHNWEEGDTVAPTCTEQGYTTYTCSKCGKEKQDDFVDALGHIRGDVYTDNGDGTHSYNCTRTEDCPGGTEAHTYVDGVCTACSAREPVTIGSTESTSTTISPYYAGMKNSTTQVIYTAEEIGQAGYISGIAYDVAKAAALETTSVKIYMGNTDKAKFAGAKDYLTTQTGLTLVYSGTPSLGTETGWEALKLDTPFFYNGIDNLIIAVVHTADVTATSLSYRYTSGTDRILYRGNNTASYADIDSDSSYYKGAYVPNVQLYMEKHTHTWVEKTPVQPTCLSEGYTPVTCEECGTETRKDIQSALGHEYGEDKLCVRCGARQLSEYADLFYAVEPYFDLSGTAAASDKWTFELREGDPVAKSTGTNTITLAALDSGTLTLSMAQNNYVGTAYYKDNGYVTVTVKDADGSAVSTRKIENSTSALPFETLSISVQQGQTVEIYCYCMSAYYFQYMKALAFTPDCEHEHAASDNGTVIAPTCTERGYTSYTCTKCEKVYRTSYTEALGHDYLETVTAPTCTEPGKKTLTCQREGCGDVVETAIPAAGHKFENGYCTVCHEKSASFTQIGESTKGSYNAPYGNYQYFSSQMLYTADSIGSGGTITKIAFNVQSAKEETASVLKVYMGHKSSTTFASNTDNLTLDDLTLVYSRTNATFGAETGWETLTLDTPFNYDGASSLVVVFVVGKTAATWDTKYAYTDTTGTVLITYSSSVNKDTYQNVETYGTVSNTLPDIQITFKSESSAHPGTLTKVEATGDCVTGGVLAHWQCNVCSRLFTDSEGKTETTLKSLTLPAGGEHSYDENGVCTVCGAVQSTQTLKLVAHEVQDGSVVIDLVAGKQFSFSVMEYYMNCTFGRAKLASAVSVLDGVDAEVNTKIGYIGLYAEGADDVSVAAGDVIASFTFTGLESEGSYRFRLSAGDCYTGTDTELPWSAGYDGEDKAALPEAIEIGTPGEDDAGTVVPVEDVVINRTGIVNAVVSGPEDGVTIDGTTENTFTVTSTVKADFLILLGTTDGEGSVSYELLTADVSGSTVSFTTALSKGQTVVIAIKGDSNGDGRVNAVDAMLALRHSAELVTLDKVAVIAADVNGDGNVNSQDATSILQYSVGKISTFG